METLPTTESTEQATRLRRRADRYVQSDYLGHFSTLSRLRGCGRRRIDAAGPIAVAVADGVAHYRNLQRCGSVHACPVCAPKIRAGRADEIERGLRRHLEQGGGAYFVTFTLRHATGMRLKMLWTVRADVAVNRDATASGALLGAVESHDAARNSEQHASIDAHDQQSGPEQFGHAVIVWEYCAGTPTPHASHEISLGMGLLLFSCEADDVPTDDGEHQGDDVERTPCDRRGRTPDRVSSTVKERVNGLTNH